eukprot:UN01266
MGHMHVTTQQIWTEVCECNQSNTNMPQSTLSRLHKKDRFYVSTTHPNGLEIHGFCVTPDRTNVMGEEENPDKSVRKKKQEVQLEPQSSIYDFDPMNIMYDEQNSDMAQQQQAQQQYLMQQLLIQQQVHQSTMAPRYANTGLPVPSSLPTSTRSQPAQDLLNKVQKSVEKDKNQKEKGRSP